MDNTEYEALKRAIDDPNYQRRLRRFLAGENAAEHIEIFFQFTIGKREYAYGLTRPPGDWSTSAEYLLEAVERAQSNVLGNFKAGDVRYRLKSLTITQDDKPLSLPPLWKSYLDREGGWERVYRSTCLTPLNK